MRKIGKRYSFDDTPMQQFIDALRLTPRQDARICARALRVPKSGDKEHQFSSFVACVGGAMAKIHPRFAQRPRAPLDRSADADGVDGLGGTAKLGGANGLRGGMG